MAAPPNQAGPPGRSDLPGRTTTVFVTSSSHSKPVDHSTTTTTITSSPTVAQSQIAQQSSKTGPNTLQITAIAIGSALFVLALVAGLAYLLFVRREKRRQSGAESKTLGAKEKYGQDSEDTYTHSFSYNQSPRDHGGTAPLLKGPTVRSRVTSGLSDISSQYDNESRRFPSEDGPSRFINGEDMVTQIPLSHAVSLADATPNAQPEEHHLDSASLLPYLSPSTSPRSLPNLGIVTDTSPPTRRSSRRKNPRGSGYYSDESDSMYSQSSASTVRYHDAQSTSALHEHELPPSLAVAPDFPPFSSQPMPYFPNAALLEEEDEQKRLAEENSILVARLLLSRTKNAPGQPSRNASLVSHIERSGSIKPAVENESGGPRSSRKESKKSYRPRLSTTAMGEEMEGLQADPPRSPLS